MIATPTSIEPAAPSPSAPSPLVPCALSLVPLPSLPLSSRDESLLFSLLDANLPLAFLIREAKMTLQQALDWWAQPHIKSAFAALTDLSQARAKAIAANDATHAVTALQSCLVLSNTDFYEQADPKTRLKAFDSARKAATQVLRLAGIGSARAASRADGGSPASARQNHDESGNPSDSAPLPGRNRQRRDPRAIRGRGFGEATADNHGGGK